MKLLPEVGRDPIGLHLRLLERHPGLQASDDPERDVVAVRGFEVEAGDRPHVGHALDVDARRKQQLEAGREHADDLRAVVAEIDRPPDDCRIAAVAALPQAVAEDRDRRQLLGRRDDRLRAVGRLRHLRLRRRIVVDEIAADEHARAEEAEDIGRRRADADLLGIAAAVGDRRPEGRDDAGEIVEKRRRLQPQIAVVRRRERPVADVPRPELAPDVHQAVSVRIWERPQEHGVDDAEDRRARADAERDCRGGDGCEAGVLPETPARVQEVLDESIHVAVTL